MQELDDISLLREYLDHESEEAFERLVTRHINKVYSIALRHTRKPHQAEEIAQAVFVILARQARQLDGHVILSGWLCRTAKLTAVTFTRSETRRAQREQDAYMQNSSDETESAVWKQIEPLLDAAMAGLNEADYHAVVLRFFDGKSMKEVGAALGASENAAKMRVNRAVEKLRLFFTKRGMVVPVAVLTAALSASSVQSAPAALAKTATMVALAKGATVSPPTLNLINGVLKIMAWTKAKTTIVAGLVTLLVAGTATVVVNSLSPPLPASVNPLAVQDPLPPETAGSDRRPGPHGVGPRGPLSSPNPNARFANLPPQQRVQQARRHYPESVDDLRNLRN